ncbi:HAD hydrolase-like protein [Patescibacteria group bacterium]|nr:HAD hydrolase-like protein [Patescibacteria group bacterium]MBU1722212.1 HAD hydrolase-like protein [Patescibacteria group bacterium]MBU1901163.1 HAD hydrolase-like protein [Patescibacteria group bacterium]
MFIFDFDDTLFDTQAFKRDRILALREVGVSQVDYDESYARAYTEGKRTCYSHERHVDVLVDIGYDRKTIEKALESTMIQIKKYLFPDAVHMLTECKCTGRKMVLLSLGGVDFQKIKVLGSGIEHFFDEIYMTETSKLEIVKQIVSAKQDEEIYLLNDKIKETQDIVDTFPQVQAVLKMSECFAQEAYHQSGLPCIKSLNDYLSYIK